MLGSLGKGSPSWTARYGIALAAVALSTAGAFLLYQIKASPSITVFLYIVGIMATAWWGGYGPGILATVLGSILGPFIANPTLTLARMEPVRFLLVIIISLLVSRAALTRRRSEETLRSTNAMLDHRVHERTADLRLANEALRKSEARLSAQADELARSNTDLAHFAYIASHDLQEPLRMIGIYVELLDRKNRAASDPDTEIYMRFILEGVRRMERLVLDLLAYSRIIHENTPATESIPLDDAVRSALQNLEPVIQETEATIEVRSLPVVQGCRTQLIQVFQNLLGNALKYHADTTPHIVVDAARLHPNSWTISVADNGIGINPQYHVSIFAPFKRLHSHEYSGTGIGLAICKRMVERWGGRIWVDSELGRGATFLFTLPDPPSPAAGLSPTTDDETIEPAAKAD